MFHVKQQAPKFTIDVSAVHSALRGAGVTTSRGQSELLVRHALAVTEANVRMNLTRIIEPRQVVDLHIVDSLAFLPHVRDALGRVVDIGSGAGYPGIPLSIIGYDVVLCESVKKKAQFLVTCAADLGISVQVVPLRAEELAREQPKSFDTAVARAVSSLAALVELAAPLLRTGGSLVALKGAPSANELLMAARAAPICGMSHSYSHEYTLPSGEDRTIAVYRRVGEPHTPLPRRPGLAQREPLGGSAT
jgi:16S rRNA (guanine527-N7)-methyltransferase